MPPFLIPFLGPVVDKLIGLIPDPVAKAKAKVDAEAALMAAQDDMIKALLSSDQAQDAINAAAAASKDAFSERARPAALWMCVAALGWQGLLLPIIQTIITYTGHIVPVLPTFSSDLTHDLLYGLLGLGGMHAYQSVQSPKIKSR